MTDKALSLVRLCSKKKDRSRSVSPQVYQDFMNCRVSLDPTASTLCLSRSRERIALSKQDIFAYGMDNSDRPSYLLWPIRGGNGQFLLVDPWSGNYFDLEAAKFVKPIGIEHFFDAFSLEKKRPLKIDAASALNIPVNEVSDSLVVSQDKAKRFELTPVWAPAEPPTKRAKTAEVRLSSASNVPRPQTNDENEKGSSDEEDSDSSGSNSDVSIQLQSRLTHPMICCLKPMRSCWAHIKKARLFSSCVSSITQLGRFASWDEGKCAAKVKAIALAKKKGFR